MRWLKKLIGRQKEETLPPVFVGPTHFANVAVGRHKECPEQVMILFGTVLGEFHGFISPDSARSLAKSLCQMAHEAQELAPFEEE